MERFTERVKLNSLFSLSEICSAGFRIPNLEGAVNLPISRSSWRESLMLTDPLILKNCYIENIINLFEPYWNLNRSYALNPGELHGTHNHVFSSKSCLPIFGCYCSSILSQKIKSSLEETMQKSQKNRLNPLKKHEVSGGGVGWTQINC